VKLEDTRIFSGNWPIPKKGLKRVSVQKKKEASV